jgi:hypothetical protein
MHLKNVEPFLANLILNVQKGDFIANFKADEKNAKNCFKKSYFPKVMKSGVFH